MTTQRSLSALKTVLVCLSFVFVFAQCAKEEELLPNASTETLDATVAADAEDTAVKSLTIDGINTMLASTLECGSCTYMVPANAQVVDGKALGIQPGETICLDKAIQYGHLSFINLKGTPEQPVTIAYGVQKIAGLSLDRNALNATDLE